MSQLSRRDLLLKSSALLAFSPVVVDLLSSTAAAADPYADGVLVDGEPDAIQQGSFSIVILPDTQNYSEKFPDTFLAQTKWVVDNQQSRNIACVLHLGDITNRNTVPEWENAVAAMSLLDGKAPYFMAPGNLTTVRTVAARIEQLV